MLLDFPDGRAAFADEEASFFITHKRPDKPFESLRYIFKSFFE